MFKFSVLSTEKAAGENVLPLRELPCLCLMICVNIIKKAAKEVLAAIFMIFYLTERKFVVLFLDRVTGYEPVGRGFESLLAHQVTCSDWHRALVKKTALKESRFPAFGKS